MALASSMWTTPTSPTCLFILVLLPVPFPIAVVSVSIVSRRTPPILKGKPPSVQGTARCFQCRVNATPHKALGFVRGRSHGMAKAHTFAKRSRLRCASRICTYNTEHCKACLGSKSFQNYRCALPSFCLEKLHLLKPSCLR